MERNESDSACTGTGAKRLHRDINRGRIETLLMDLYAEAGEPPPRLRPPNRNGAGLVGQVYTSHLTQKQVFMDKLADLMVAYNVDRVDVAWSVEHALQNFAERPGTECGICGERHATEGSHT